MDYRKEHTEALIYDECPDCTCEEFADHIFELLDSYLTRDEQERLLHHAQHCEHCTHLSDVEKHMRSLIRSACCDNEAPEHLRVRIVQQLTRAYVIEE